MPVTEIKSPMFPISEIIHQFKYPTALHLAIVKAPHCCQGPFLQLSPGCLSHTVRTCAVHSLGSCFCRSFLFKNIPTPMLILYLFSSNLDSLVLFHSYISCSVDVSFYLFWSFNVRQIGIPPSKITTTLPSSDGTLVGSNILRSYEAYTALNYIATAALSSHIFE